MILTVTANTTLDQTLFVPTWELNRTIRATQTIQSMGGKPTDASWILGKLGIPSLALGFAAGVIGERVKDMLHERGVTTDFIAVDGQTRINTVIVTPQGQTTITTDTLEVTPQHLAELRRKFETALDTATCVVLGGTLPKNVPPTFYSDFIDLANQQGVPTIFDADEPNLSAGLLASPTFVKPNEHELAALVGYPVESVGTAYQAGREVQARYKTSPVITLGEHGALAVLPDRAYYIPPLNVPVVSTSGAGDGMLAGLASAVFRKQPIEEGLRLGAALASAIVNQAGTADYDQETLEHLLEQVVLIPFSG